MHWLRAGIAAVERGRFVKRIGNEGTPALTSLVRRVTPVFITCLAFLAAAAVSGEEETTITEATRNDAGLLVHRVHSPYQAGETEIHVLLPSDLAPDETCRVLFVLPVEPGTEHRWGDPMAELQQAQIPNRHRLVCVYPTFSHWPWYADHPSDPAIRQETYFLNVVLPHVERAYPVKRDTCSRRLVGFSKSGWGAFTLLLRHPDTFGRAAAWDAPLNFQNPNQFEMDKILGTQENFVTYQVSRLVEQQAAAVQEGQRLIHLGYGNFRDHHLAIEQLLIEHKISHYFHDGPKREHAWTSGWLTEAVDLLVR